MTDYRQEAVPPEYRNLVLNPGGEQTSLGSTYVASNGNARTGVTPALGGPAPASGAAVVEYEVLDNTSLSYYFAPLGPNEVVHRGGFKIPEGRTVSARVKVRASAACWVQVQAAWMTELWANGEAAGLSSPIQVDAVEAASIGTGGWTTVEVFIGSLDIPDGATHWRPLVAVFAADPVTTPTPPAVGLKVYADEFFVPDSGVDLAGVPYGDGSSAGWEWEGQPNYSSSRVVPRPTPALVNLVVNPSFEAGTASWAGVGDVTIAQAGVGTDAGVVGSQLASVGSGAAKAAGDWLVQTAPIEVFEGYTYSLTGRARRSTTGAGSSNLRLRVGWYSDEAATASLGVSEVAFSVLAGSPATLQTGEIEGAVAPAGAVSARVGLAVDAALDASQTFRIDAFSLVASATNPGYFDGDTADDAEFTYDWLGAAHDSQSGKYAVTVDAVEPDSTGDDAPTVPPDDDPETTGDLGDAVASDPLPSAPVVPDASLDDPGTRPTGARPLVIEAEDVIGWKNENRHLCLSADVQVEGLVMNTMDEFGVVWLVSDIDGWWTTPEPEVPDVPRAWFDGSYETRGRYTARTFTLTGSFVPRSPRDVAAARDRLIRAVNLCHRGGWFMTHEQESGSVLTKGAKVWLAGQPLIATNGLNGKTDFSIALRAPDSLKHSIKDAVPPGYNSIRVLTSSSAYPERGYPREYPWAYPEAVFGSTRAIVINEGNAVTWPILRLAGPTNGALKIYNADTGQEFRIVKRLYPGEVLEIDCFTRQVTLNGEGNHRFYLDVDVDWLMLQPGPNKIWFAEETIGGIRTELEVLWRSSWIG